MFILLAKYLLSNQCLLMLKNLFVGVAFFNMELADIEKLQEKFFTCEICDEPAFHDKTDFHILPCQHTICEGCVNGLIERKQNNEPLLCPWCRQDFSVPEGGKLPTFRYAADLLLEFNAMKTAKYAIMKEVSEQSTPNSASQNQKSKHGKILLLKKLNFELFSYNIWWPGTGGKFYGRPSHYGKGLSYINILDKAKITRFADKRYTYAGMAFIDEELFTFNVTKGRIEVYKNGVFIRMWKVCPSGPNTCFNLGAVLSRYLRLIVALPNGSFCILHFTANGDLIETAQTTFDWSFFLLISCEVTYQGSSWLIIYEDTCLWEIPIEKRNGKIYYKNPVKHCQIGEYTSACKFGEGKIAFAVGKSVKIIDLADFSSQRNRDRTDRKQRGRATKEVKPTVHNLLTDVYQKSHRLIISEDGYVVMQGEDESTSVYQLVPSDKDIQVETVTLSHEKIPGPPVYPQNSDLKKKRFYQRRMRFFCDEVLTFAKEHYLFWILIAISWVIQIWFM